MAGWKIQTASYKGVAFEWIRASGRWEERAQVTEYPDRDGASIQRLGSAPLDETLTIIVRNAEYPARFNALMRAVRDREPGRFVHPAWGSFSNVHALLVEYDAGVEVGINAVAARVRFVQADKPATVAPAAASPTATAGEGRAEVQAAIGQSYDYSLPTSAWSRAQNSLLAALRQFTNYGLLTSYYIETCLENVDVWSGRLADGIDAWLDAAQDVSTSVPDLIQGLSDGLREILDALKRDRGLSRDLMDGLEDGSGSAPSDPAYAAYYATASSCRLGLCRRACELLDLYAQDMTANEVERTAAIVRLGLGRAANAMRVLFASSAANPAESLEASAAEVLVFAERAKAARPPVIQIEVATERPLVLIAHELYGDHSRDQELMRLNPDIVNPAFVPAGAMLQAYAS